MKTKTASQWLQELKQVRLTLRSSEVATLLGVSNRTLLRWRANGDGPPYISAGAYSTALYPIDKLERWIEEEAV